VIIGIKIMKENLKRILKKLPLIVLTPILLILLSILYIKLSQFITWIVTIIVVLYVTFSCILEFFISLLKLYVG
jgi:hypothetical protein